MCSLPFRIAYFAIPMGVTVVASHALAHEAAPQTILVTTCANSGPGSLRQAVADAGAGGWIGLGSLPCADRTIRLVGGPIVVMNSAALTISARNESLVSTSPAPMDGTFATATIDAAGASRIFTQSGSGAFNLQGLVLRNGHAHGAGGCVFTQGDLTLQDSVVRDCIVDGAAFGEARGGGIAANGALSLLWSDVVGNSVVDDGYAMGGGVAVAGALVLHYGTIANNRATTNGGVGVGGGLYAMGDAEIAWSAISGNEATTVGGADLVGQDGTATLRIFDSTISGNTGGVGGVLALQSALTIASSTIAFNISTIENGIGGVSNWGVTLQSALLANNTGLDLGVQCVTPPCSGSVEGADNLVMTSNMTLPSGTLSADPHLLPLAGNGGVTSTHALASDSPAIDHGNATGPGGGPLSFDQRGFGYPRVVGAAADIGAFESGAGPDTIFFDGFDCGVAPLADPTNLAC